jgi:hypothetical protein
MNPLTITLLILVACTFVFHLCVSLCDYFKKKNHKNGASKQWRQARNELWAWNYDHPYTTENNPELQRLIQIETGAYMRYIEWHPEKADNDYLEDLLRKIPSQQKNS